MKKVKMDVQILGSSGWEFSRTAIFKPVSRWITVKQNYNANKRNNLYCYVTDENGYNSQSDKFDPAGGTYLDYFRWNGRNYAIGQFIRLGSMWEPFTYSWEDKSGKRYYLSGVDGENIYSPIYIELDEYCERVRVWEEVHENVY